MGTSLGTSVSGSPASGAAEALVNGRSGQWPPRKTEPIGILALVPHATAGRASIRASSSCGVTKGGGVSRVNGELGNRQGLGGAGVAISLESMVRLDTHSR